MKHTVCAIVFIGAAFSIATRAAETDTTRTYRAAEVVVTATRSSLDPADVPARVHILSSEIFTTGETKTLPQILRTLEGMFIKDYGSAASAKMISIRGLSSANMLILRDGIPLNDPQYGSLDLNLLSLQHTDRVEVVEGGASAFYGGNAAAGVVNIISRKPSENFRSAFRVGGGSFGERTYAAEAEGTAAGIGLQGAFRYETGKENFPFTVGSNSFTRRNADFQHRQLTLGANYNFTSNFSIDALCEVLNLEQGVPGSFSYPSDNARQHDKVFRASLSSSGRFSDALALQVTAYTIRSTQNYREPSLWGNTDLLYTTRHTGGSIQTELQAANTDRILAGASIISQTLDASGESWGMPFEMKPRRTSTALWFSNEWTLTREASFFDRFMLFTSGRYEHYSDISKGTFAPKAGITIRVIPEHDLRLWASVARNVRIPTFNDLYYPNYSNPDLKAEESLSYEGGIRLSLDKENTHTLQANAYSMNIENKIVLNEFWKPYNIGKAEHNGFDIRYEYHSPNRGLNAYAGVSFVNARKTHKSSPSDSTYKKYLPYVPLSTGAFGITSHTSIGTVTIQETITGIQYTNEMNTSHLPAYSTTDIFYSTEYPISSFRCNLSVAITNVFDLQYQIYPDYPMPGRVYRITFSVIY